MGSVTFRVSLVISLILLCALQYGTTFADSPPKEIEDIDLSKLGPNPQDTENIKYRRSDSTEVKREKRVVSQFVSHFKPEDQKTYIEKAKRHILVFTPAGKKKKVKSTLMAAADRILNPPPFQPKKAAEGETPSNTQKWTNAGGGAYMFLVVDMGNPDNDAVTERFVVPKDTKQPIIRCAEFPKEAPMRVFKPDFKYKLGTKSKARYINTLTRFVKSIRDRKAKRVIRSQSVNEEQTISDSNFIEAVGSNFNFIVKKPSDDVVVFAYLPSCPHCKKFMEKFKTLAAEADEQKLENMKFVAINMAENDQDVVESKSYPAVAFLPAHEKNKKKFVPIMFKDTSGEMEAFRYFVDKNRFHQDQPRLSKPYNGYEIWDSSIPKLDAESFTKFLTASETNKVLVMFYTEESLHSREMQPTFGTAAHQIGFKNFDFAKVNCLEIGGQRFEYINSRLCEYHNIKVVPSMVYFDVASFRKGTEYNSTFTNLDMLLTVDSITQYAKTMLVDSAMKKEGL